MQKKFYSLFIGIVFLATASASASSEYFVDGALGIGDNRSSGVLSLYFLKPYFETVLGTDRLKLGLGLRLTSFQGKDIKYTTAPKNLIARNDVFTLEIDSAQTHSLSGAVYLQMQATETISGGFILDVIGTGFGNQAIGTYRSKNPAFNNTRQKANPTPRTLFAGGDADIGQVGSEFYASYQWDSWVGRLGVLHLFSEYTTEKKLDNANTRFRATSNLIFVSLSYGF